jgi:hypothetical protein
MAHDSVLSQTTRLCLQLVTMTLAYTGKLNDQQTVDHVMCKAASDIGLMQLSLKLGASQGGDHLLSFVFNGQSYYCTVFDAFGEMSDFRSTPHQILPHKAVA